MKIERKNISNKITKLTLVIYFIFMIACTIACVIASAMIKDWTLSYGFLVCLGPSLIFVIISSLLPINKFFDSKSKRAIFLYSLLYVIKYILIFAIPVICLAYGETYFNRWTMMATTLIAPITVIVLKLIIAIKDSKKAKKDETKPINTIKF